MAVINSRGSFVCITYQPCIINTAHAELWHSGLTGNHHVNKSMQFRPTRTPLLYSKTGFQGCTLFLHFLHFFEFKEVLFWTWLVYSLKVTHMYPNGKLDQYVMIYAVLVLLKRHHIEIHILHKGVNLMTPWSLMFATVCFWLWPSLTRSKLVKIRLTFMKHDKMDN